MKKLFLLIPLLFTGCATYTVAGYSTKPMSKADEDTLKKGTAYCVLGFGDCTDSRAARDGGITEIVASTQTRYSVFGIRKTTVYGK